MIQKTFDDIPFEPRTLARTENPDTSKAAARSCRELRGAHHEAILTVLMSVPNANADEIAAKCENLDRHQIGRRLHELAKANYVRVVPGVLRATASGRMAQCYEVVK